VWLRNRGVQCLNTEAGTGVDDAGSWEPDDYVSYNTYSQEYEVDEVLVEALNDDASILANDGTFLAPLSGGWEFRSVGTNSLAYHLGFQTGDIPQTVNGMNVTTLGGVLAARVELANATSFTVVFKRGSTVITHEYVVQ
jgi:hypothetical protein